MWEKVKGCYYGVIKWFQAWRLLDLEDYILLLKSFQNGDWIMGWVVTQMGLGIQI